MDSTKQFLKKLLDFGTKEGYFNASKNQIEAYFQLSEIGKLKDERGNITSCCPDLLINVIDFDITKKVHGKIHDIKTVCSCDALFIKVESGNIFFIEMKGMTKYMQYNPTANNDEIEAQVARFDFINKVRDSITILTNIVQSKRFDATREEQDLFFNIPQYIIILTDIKLNSVIGLDFTLNHLAKVNTSKEDFIAQLMEKKVEKVQLRASTNIQKPILATCDTLHKHLR